jgi:hypothetical protein
VLARVRQQDSERLDDPLSMRIRQSAGDEVVEHVDDHERLHPEHLSSAGERQRVRRPRFLD